MSPEPIVYRNDDGTCLIDWRTPDGNMPTEMLLMSPELIRECVDAINEAIRLRARVAELGLDLALAQHEADRARCEANELVEHDALERERRYSGEFVVTSSYSKDGLGLVSEFHRHGIPWQDAPKPDRWHRHRPQSRVVSTGLRLVRDWCACGASRIDGGKWIRGEEPQ